MKIFTLRVALLAALGMLALSGCANSDGFNLGGGGSSASPGNGCGTNRVEHCQRDPLTPRGPEL